MNSSVKGEEKNRKKKDPSQSKRHETFFFLEWF